MKQPHTAHLKSNGIVEAFNEYGLNEIEFEGPYSKELHEKILKSNPSAYLDGFNNADSRMKGYEIIEKA